MKHLDLFSGIGGFALAIDRVWNDVEHTFCEIDPFCQEVLKKHWPNSKIYDDIRTPRFDSDSDSDRRSGGTQEINPAETGKQTLNDIKKRNRTLTTDPEHNGSPRTEETGTDSGSQSESSSRQKLSLNEPKGNNGLREKESGWDILTGGFPCQPFSQAGRRKGTDDNRFLWPEMLRVIREFNPLWVIAENVRGLLTIQQGVVFQQVCVDLENAGYEVQPLIIPAVAVNAPHRRDRVWIVAHTKSAGARSERGTSANQRGRASEDRGTSIRQAHGKIGAGGATTADSNAQNSIGKRGGRRVESNGQILERESTKTKDARPSWETHWLEVATRLCRVDDGIPRRMDRNPRLKALGNAIVPQVAEEIFKAIKCISTTK